MAASNNNEQAFGASCEEVRTLRVWRALFTELYGGVRALDDFRFLLGMADEDALGALGLSGSVWAAGRLQALRAALA